MAASTPLTALTLHASSVADDLGYVALGDLAAALGDIAADYRVIGGHNGHDARRALAAWRAISGDR